MIDFDGKELQEEFNKVFGNLRIVNFPNQAEGEDDSLKITNLSLDQLWWLTKFGKHIRGRCRNNSAFNNFMNRNFSPARFHTVQKTYNGKIYDGLEIHLENKKIGDEDQ